MRNAKEVNTTYIDDCKQLDFYGTVRADGTPHITLITSLHLYGEDKLIWGEYSAGMSKENQKIRHKVGFLSLIEDEELVFGKARWIESKSHGEELELLNQIPQFRYNNVYGYSPVHILETKELVTEKIDKIAVQTAVENTKAAAVKGGTGGNPNAFSIVTKALLSAGEGYKVLSYVDKDGHPRLIPVPQAVIAMDNRLIFSLTPHESYLSDLYPGMELALLGVSYSDMCTVLVNGKFKTVDIKGEIFGALDVEKVYSPMLPVFGFVYPKELAKPKVVKEFEHTLYEYNV